MEVNLRTAKKREKPIMENLMQLYLHDLSEIEDLPLDDSGQFHYEHLDEYWQNPNRYPFLIRVDNQLAGLALLRYDIDYRSMLERMELVDFFILRSHRGQGIGKQAAVRLWNLFPVKWQVRVLNSNTEALPFWQKVIGDYTQGNADEKKEEGMVSRFVTFNFVSNTPGIPEDEIPPEPLDF